MKRILNSKVLKSVVAALVVSVSLTTVTSAAYAAPCGDPGYWETPTGDEPGGASGPRTDTVGTYPLPSQGTVQVDRVNAHRNSRMLYTFDGLAPAAALKPAYLALGFNPTLSNVPTFYNQILSDLTPTQTVLTLSAPTSDFALIITDVDSTDQVDVSVLYQDGTTSSDLSAWTVLGGFGDMSIQSTPGTDPAAALNYDAVNGQLTSTEDVNSNRSFVALQPDKEVVSMTMTLNSDESNGHVYYSLYSMPECSFDLALQKTVNSGTTLPPAAGDLVTFDITLTNQSSDVQTIDVVDYIQSGFEYDPADNAAGTATDSGNGDLFDYTWGGAAGDTAPVVEIRPSSGTETFVKDETITIPITLKIEDSWDGSEIVNWAEISNFDDNTDSSDGDASQAGSGTQLTDEDSTPDETQANDAQPENPDDPGDNEIDGNGDGLDPVTGDEDDHDLAGVVGEEPEPEPGPDTYSLGNQVWSDDNNNGLIDAGESFFEGIWMELFTDNDNDGLPDDTNMDGVIDVNDAIATTGTDANGLYLFDGLEAGDYIVGIPPMEWDAGGPLYGYLSSTPTSVTPDDDIDNDDNGTPGPYGYVWSGPVDLSGNEPLAEDPDNDPNTADANENLTVDFGFYQPVFDLALRKQLDDGTNIGEVVAGDTVSFNIEVFNQGSVDAFEPSLIDYTPVGLTLADSDWTLDANGNATISLVGVTIAAGESVVVPIDFTVDQDASGSIVNQAEITGATPVTSSGEIILMPNGKVLPDIDSVPDAVNEDTLVDDIIDNSEGDEDDHDEAQLVLSSSSQILAITGISTLTMVTIAMGFVFSGFFLRRKTYSKAV